MMGVCRVAGILLCNHLDGDPGQIVVAPSIGQRSWIHERYRVYVSHIADFQTHF